MSSFFWAQNSSTDSLAAANQEVSEHQKKPNLSKDEEISKGLELAKNALQKLKIYIGEMVESTETPLNLNWVAGYSRDGVSVRSSAVTNSSWVVVQGMTIIKADKMAIKDLYLNDDRLKDYDDMFDSYTVSLFNFFYPLMRYRRYFI